MAITLGPVRQALVEQTLYTHGVAMLFKFVGTVAELRSKLRCEGCEELDTCHCGATANEPHSGFNAVA